jgi:16S rRNA (guanine527-N7)-methyltransferase
MDTNIFLNELLIKGASEFGAKLTNPQVDAFLRYKDILKEWNEKMNLTAIEEDKDVIIKHFLDSLSIIPDLKSGKQKIIDVGTGAGFPGIPLKIIFDQAEVTLFDSLEKRVRFLTEVVSLLNLTGIRAVHGRAEDFGVKPEYREQFDIAVARAVASLPVLLEYCLPFVKPGGLFIAMKGSNTEEMAASQKALELLGGEIDSVREIILPFSDMKRNIIRVRKLRQTPTKYPRKAGKPSKEPLI